MPAINYTIGTVNRVAMVTARDASHASAMPRTQSATPRKRASVDQSLYRTPSPAHISSYRYTMICALIICIDPMLTPVVKGD